MLIVHEPPSQKSSQPTMLLTMLLAASSGFAGPGSRAPALARRTRFCTATAAKSHEGWMHYALQLAERGRFSTAPNPWHACECSNRSLPIMYSHAVARRARLLRVGCVIVAADGIEVLAEGFHKQKGGLHAEAAALAEAKARGVSREQMSEATCYVTLEPCHRGPGKTTPPCDEALVASGLRRIHIAIIDPDPAFGNAGVAHLEAHGIQVTTGTGAAAVATSLQPYLHQRLTKRPWVVLKVGSTLIASDELR